MFTVYVLKSCEKKYIYVGFSNDILRRLKQHQNGRVPSTKSYRPFKLLHKETFGTRQDARIREKYLKSGIGKEWIKSRFL